MPYLGKRFPFSFNTTTVVFGVLIVVFFVMLTLIPELALSMIWFCYILLMILAPFCVVGIWCAACSFQGISGNLFLPGLVATVLVLYSCSGNLAYGVTGGREPVDSPE